MSATKGFTLFEVLIALVILAVGLLGGAKMMIQSIRSHHAAVQHTQAVLVGESIMDRMSANVVGVWLSAYDGTYTAGSASSASASTCSSASCTPTDIANRDRYQWWEEVTQQLPEGTTANLTCTAKTPAPNLAMLRKAPAYDGYCDLSLHWAEQQTGGAVEQQLASWRFIP